MRKRSGIYASTDRTGRNDEVIKQLSKARTDFHTLKQTPYIVAQRLPSDNSGGVSTASNSSDDGSNMSGEESGSSDEEYIPYCANNFCIPL